MPAYHYEALNAQGKTVRGVKLADSAKQVRQLLRDEKLSPLSVREVSEKKSSSPALFRKKFKATDRALFFRQLATLLAAGSPVSDALSAVAEQMDKPHLKSVILGVRARVLEGHTLAYALGQFPDAFPELYCATVGAGEQSGHLDVVLTRLAEHSERAQSMRQKVQQALIYPSMMTLVSIAIVSFLLVFVVPKIIAVFSSTGQALPTATLVLIDISWLIRKAGLWLLLLLLIALYLFKRLLKTPAYRYRWHQFLLRLPFISYLITNVNTARFARTLGILSSAGVSVLEAMRVASRLVLCLPIQEAIEAAVVQVKEGRSISRALKETGYFSPMAIHLIASGEQAGELDSMLAHAALHQEEEVTRIINTGLTLLEPMIIVLMGAVVLFIVLAILLPIFSMEQLNF